MANSFILVVWQGSEYDDSYNHYLLEDMLLKNERSDILPSVVNDSHFITDWNLAQIWAGIYQFYFTNSGVGSKFGIGTERGNPPTRNEHTSKSPL